jgi:4-hydroxy 2-oxovalerate aldolase
MIKILDCTLRDGGYYTNWDFEDAIVDSYISNLNALPIDYIELGYRNKPQTEYLGQYGYCPVSTLKHIRFLSEKKLAVMLNEKDSRLEDLDQLLSPTEGLVDMVRLAVDPKNFDRAIVLAKAVKEKGLSVAFNMMYMSTWSGIEGFYSKLSQLDGIADLFCMVDSFGSMTPELVKETILQVQRNTDTKLGFHGHNNLQLALINALTALEHGVEVIDATIMGMGRGAGNLNLELLLTYLNKYQNLYVDFNRLGDAVQSFEALQHQYNWGTNLPYMLSGANSIPQKEVMAWVQNRVYSFNSIVRALDNRKDGVQDNAKYPLFKARKKYQHVIVVGGGASIKRHIDGIKIFAEKHDTAIVFATSRFTELFDGVMCDKFYILVGNEGKRLFTKIHGDEFRDTCILPPYPRVMGTDVPPFAQGHTYELSDISVIGKYTDSCTTVALQLSSLLSSEDVYISGYDGYKGEALTEKEITLNKENSEIFELYKSNTGEALISLLPTLYLELKVESVYSKL